MAHRIKELIKEKGYTQQSLADRLGIARESLSRMLVSPSYPTLEKIANALEVNIWELFISPEGLRGNVTSSIICPHCGKSVNIKVE